MSHDFTIARYREVLSQAKARFRFVQFDFPFEEGNIALWRHDVDFSPQRAVVMAAIEADAGVMATYFFQLSSRYYNLFEPDIVSIVREIAKLGHDIGLHFEVQASIDGKQPNHEGELQFQAAALSHICGKPVTSFSLHNPTTIIGIPLDDQQHSGLINASYSGLRERFSYCSDSNGVWRFRSLDEMIQDPDVTMLYALTHPEWWQETVMLPRDRLQRCIDGRARRSARYYDELLCANLRPNVGRGE